MKRLFLAASVLLLTACTASHEASYVDSEFGQAMQITFDSQVAFPGSPHEGEIPAGLEGINSEELMNAHVNSLSEATEKTKVFTLGFSDFMD